jgi:hypothetical protein
VVKKVESRQRILQAILPLEVFDDFAKIAAGAGVLARGADKALKRRPKSLLDADTQERIGNFAVDNATNFVIELTGLSGS